MRVVAEKTLRAYWEKHSDVRGPLEAWYEHVCRINWVSAADVLNDYKYASVLPNNYVVFNIKGNTYRLVVRIQYNAGIIYIRFIGTHAEYDRIDATRV